uniref:Uncharacterized protein n=1 Tax=Oryctolagus cuniculus TaxID=9986 RepID=A0A5F9C5S7_RABIT
MKFLVPGPAVMSFKNKSEASCLAKLTNTYCLRAQGSENYRRQKKSWLVCSGWNSSDRQWLTRCQ